LKVLLFTKQEVEKLISMRDAIDAVERAFKSKALGKVQMPPKPYVYFNKYGGDFRTMPAYLEEEDIVGVKIVNVHPKNPKKYGLPSVMAVILLLDPKTGAPLSVMDGTWLTNLRTGAGGAVAAKNLARKDSSVVGMIGAGAQARTQLRGLCEVFKIKLCKVMEPNVEKVKKYSEEMSKELGIEVKPVESIEETVRDSDVVVTTTPVASPIVKSEWISPGTHINAIGADAPGKEELDPAILKKAKVVVDDIEQASHGGEINVPLSQGLISSADIYAELGDIMIGKKQGRTSADEITVFDSTGLAIQDVSTAHHVYKKGKELKLGIEIDLF
jgi:alanine dehydrogenase